MYAQDKHLSISQPGSDKETIFKENKRVKVKTIQGEKISGKLHFVDETQIMIKNSIIPITNISEIRRHPLLLNILVSSAIIAGGGFVVFVGFAVVVVGGSVAIGIAIGVLGAAIIFGGIKSPNLSPNIQIKYNTTVNMPTQLQ